MQRTSAALCALLAGAGFAATAATSSQAAEPNRFSCSAQPLNAKVAGQAAITPSGAGSDTGSCGNSTGGGGGTLPALGVLEGVYASTAIFPSADVAPALQQPSARSGVLNLQLAGALGFRIQGVTSAVSASCSGGVPRYSASGGVTGITVAGQNIPLVDGVTQVAGLGGLLGGLPVRVELNRQIQDSTGFTIRALRLSAPADGSAIDVTAGTSHIGVSGSPCTDGPTPGPNPGPTPGPTPNGSGGGAAGANPLFPAGYAYLRNSPCIKSKAFGVKPGILGNAKKNRLKGTKKANRIMGYGASDRLTGGGGRDCIEGGTGNDVESGGVKADMLFGRQGNDRLDGGSGNDRLAGASGKDRLKGGSGNDRITGDSGNDRIAGGPGKDRLLGGAGNDRITGGSGRDRINCGKGRDVAIIGKGDKAARNCERVIRKKGKRY